MPSAPNRRRMRSQLGTRTTRRNGTKSRHRMSLRPAARLRLLLKRYEEGEVDASGRELA